ncbi:hypothetical protein HDC94_002837 [Leifsonia sp. AK011]|uniref:hypothetical protein n=1 Tax=Leifsonia sp. AK011 TaxID=2723075 RepID=UPI0015CCFAD9|nr:hypothetical protein [Leifsonia sp. AK011]NYF11681.1 hypothetical protein [Leifsonia sp. AK011]
MPAAANADYVPESNIIVTGSFVPGGVVTVTFTDGSFFPGEPVTFTITGEPTPSLAALGSQMGTLETTGTADAAGAVAVQFVLPSNAQGTYTVTAVGEVSGNIGSAAITVTPADSGGTTGPGGLVNTGSELSALVIWGAIGALLVGTALVMALQVRRNRAHTHA